MPATGLNKYNRVLVQYDKQVVGVRRGGATTYDSLQVLKTIRQLIKASQQQVMDTLSTTVDKKIAVNENTGSPLSVAKPAPVLNSSKPAIHASKVPPVAVPVSRSTSIKKPVSSSIKPKAIMPKRE